MLRKVLPRLITFGLLTVATIPIVYSFQSEGKVPAQEFNLDVYSMTPQQFRDEGEKIIFGGIGRQKVQGAIGRGQCPLCHGFQPGFLSERAPNLFGVTKQASRRLQELRYHMGNPQGRDTVTKESCPGCGTGMTPLEYIVESVVCPNCFIVEGFGLRGTKDTDGGCPFPHQRPILLSKPDLIIIISWLYLHDGKTPPHPILIDSALKKFVPISEWERAHHIRQLRASRKDVPVVKTATGDITVEKIFSLGGCNACHIIPGIKGAIGRQGPPLTMKITGSQRLKDPSYKGTAKTLREYLIESILDPDRYIVPGFPASMMPQDYNEKFSAGALMKMVEYLENLEGGKSSQPPE